RHSDAKGVAYQSPGSRACERTLVHLSAKPSDHQRDVLASEAKRVAEYEVARSLAGGVGNIVEVAVGVGVFVVDRGRQHVVANGHEAYDHLGHAGSGDQMSHHALGARHGRLHRPLAKHLLACHRLDTVVHGSTGAVGIDVLNI